MPAKSKSQKQLMAWAYACKKKYVKNCPEKVMKIANSMSEKQLKDFFENSIYNVKNTSRLKLLEILQDLMEKEIDFDLNEDDELVVFGDYIFSNESDGIEEIWNGFNFIYELDVAVPGTNLGNVSGMGKVHPPTNIMPNNSGNNIKGSGDRFDNETLFKKRKKKVRAFRRKLKRNNEKII